MASTFFQRIADLEHRVGTGSAKVTITNDQVYSHYQHEGLDLIHPRGGQARFLATALMDTGREGLERMADALVSDGDVAEAGRAAGQRVIDAAIPLTPVEFENLRRSYALDVTDNGQTRLHQAPEVARLTEQELEDQRRLARGGNVRGRRYP